MQAMDTKESPRTQRYQQQDGVQFPSSVQNAKRSHDHAYSSPQQPEDRVQLTESLKAAKKMN